MKKLNLFLAIMYGCMALFIPYMFLTYTKPTGGNLTAMCMLFTLSVLASYNYASNK